MNDNGDKKNAAIAGAVTLSAKELNDIKFVRDKTLLTPELLAKMRVPSRTPGE